MLLLDIASVLLVVVLTFVIAAGIVGRETQRLDAVAPSPAFDLDEAVNYIADRLPLEVSAVLSHDDVRKVVTYSLEYFRSRGTLRNGSQPHTPGPAVVVQGAETVEYVQSRVAQAGLDISIEQIYAVLDGELGYLEEIGAIGPQARENPEISD